MADITDRPADDDSPAAEMIAGTIAFAKELERITKNPPELQILIDGFVARYGR